MSKFYVQDQGVFIPTNDLAQAFVAINFVQRNSLGVGTDNLIPVVNPDNPNWIADIQTQDYWGYNSAGNIFRMTSVGIQSSAPYTTLDIGGTVHATDDVDFDKNLNVDGYATINASIQSNDKDTGALVLTNGGLGVEGNTNIGGYLNVDGYATINASIESTDKDTGALVVTNGGLGVEGNTNIGGYLNVDDYATINASIESTDKDTGALVVTNGGLGVEGNTNIGGYLNVDSYATINSSTESTSKDTGALIVTNGGLGVEGNTNIGGYLNVDGYGTINSSTESTSKDTGALVLSNGGLGVEGNTNIGGYINVDGYGVINSSTQSTSKDTGALVLSNGGLGVEGNAYIGSFLDVGGDALINGNTSSSNKDTGALVVQGGVGIEENLNVGGNTKLIGTLELDNALIDINGSVAAGKTDYRLASVGTGVSWRPAGVETKRAIWVTMNGNDSNSGLLEGDAKRTIGAAAAIAQEGDTIFVRSGVYYENNPIGLRTDVSVSGQDLRLVSVIPKNPTKDVFHVRRGCLIENLNFSGTSVSVAHTGCGAVAFPPTLSDVNAGISSAALSGYLEFGPATEGTSGRWRSPYVRNCTNFMKESIGMKINGNHASVTDPLNIGADLKSMVCDSFTQYNENGIGVSITNNGYAQLVSIFTINCNIGIYCDTGGSCDITNSNSSFGNYGLYAVGLGKTEFTSVVSTEGSSGDSDTVILTNVSDNLNNPRRPYDGQGLFFEIDLSNYSDAVTTGLSTTILESPMVNVRSITVTNGGSGYTEANPPVVIIRDSDGTLQPKGPQGIIAEASPTIDPQTGSIVQIDVINSGRNYLPTQNLIVDIEGSATAEVVTEPIYFTINTATSPTNPVGRYADAVSLINKNLDFIANEAVDQMLYYYNVTLGTPFSVPGGSQKCVSDVKLVLGSICHNLVFGGNDFTYDAAKIYVDNTYLSGEEAQSVKTYEYARDIAKQIINNVTVTKQNYSGINVYSQVKDLTILADPLTGSNTDPNSCANVKTAIDNLFSIIITAINSDTLPASRTVGNTVGISTITLNEFIPYELFGGEKVSLRRISRILTSSHCFEYIGTGTDINISTPFKGAVPIKDNEVVAIGGAKIPFTSTDQRGNFDIGKGFQINQPSSTIRGRDFSKAIQAEVTPLILALR